MVYTGDLILIDYLFSSSSSSISVQFIPFCIPLDELFVFLEIEFVLSYVCYLLSRWRVFNLSILRLNPDVFSPLESSLSSLLF